MKKNSIIILLIATLAVAAFASFRGTFCFADGGDNEITLFVGEGSYSGPLIRMTTFSISCDLPIQVLYDPALSTVFIEFRNNMGSSLIELENVTTGEQTQTFYAGSTGVIPLPVTGQPGACRLSVTVSNGCVYSGWFDIQ